MFDADEFRARSRENWDRAAAGWERQRERLRAVAEPVAQRMVEAVDPQPGQTILELAAGLADPGFLAAARVAPGGRVIVSDQSPEMVEAARRRGEELGAENVDYRVLEAEWLDLGAASVDAILCRWGLMLMADPGAALGEMRRVTRPGGRVALSVWDAPEHNPWAAIPGGALVERTLLPAPEPGAPGMFALADRNHLAESMRDAGFGDVEVDPVDFEYRYRDLDEWWATHIDLSQMTATAVAGLADAEVRAVRDDIASRAAPFVSASGEVALPARALVAAGGA